jgi:hypothetical protein
MQLEEERITFQYPKRAKELDGTYYHVSTRDYQEEQSAWSPWVPLDSGINELDIPRICVAPTISKCLLAINYKAYSYDRFIIYKTNAEVYYPIGVLDAEVTKEMWVLSPTTFTKCGEISKGQFKKEVWKKFKEILKDSYYIGWSVDGSMNKTLKCYLYQLKTFLEQTGVEETP